MNAAFFTMEQAVAGEHPDWRQGAPCGEVDADLFFDRAEEDELDLMTAKIICASCPVAADCLDSAMLNREEFGIWGGLTPEERKGYMRQWLRLKGGRGTVKAMRQSNGILSAAPHIDRKYEARHEAAMRCREKLLAEQTTHRREEYLMVLDLIIANPAEVSDKLASRIGRSATWFNTMKRDVYALFDIKEGVA